MLTFAADGPVLIAGGTGVVGVETARLLQAHHPELPLVLAGRDPDRATEVREAIGAGFLAWDVTRPPPKVGARAVIGCVNDPNDEVLRACLRGGVPLVDITRWTSRLQQALAIAAVLPPRAPLVLASGWAGGVVPRLAALAAGLAGPGATIDSVVRYDLADRSGVDSVEFLDRLDRGFEAGGRSVRALGQPQRVRVGDFRVLAARVDTPEQFTVPAVLDCGPVSTRLGFSSLTASATLLAAERVGLFRLLRGDRYRRLRRGLLHSPGDGGIAVLTVRAQGPRDDVTATLTDRAGQAHLTGTGAVLGLREALTGGAGVHLPELAPTEGLIEQLAAFGVQVVLTRRAAPRPAGVGEA